MEKQKMNNNVFTRPKVVFQLQITNRKATIYIVQLSIRDIGRNSAAMQFVITATNFESNLLTVCQLFREYCCDYRMYATPIWRKRVGSQISGRYQLTNLQSSGIYSLPCVKAIVVWSMKFATGHPSTGNIWQFGK